MLLGSRSAGRRRWTGPVDSTAGGGPRDRVAISGKAIAEDASVYAVSSAPSGEAADTSAPVRRVRKSAMVVIWSSV